ncbi:MAG TPA: ankyrin repeat domain-containing protein [Rickettsia endosymbiont of Pyrocoelia pectoralis]|nr:ankyrin repeat domain-containing protein [Rickettsia endosymbiont of Pyrocoelia pectoralis]
MPKKHHKKKLPAQAVQRNDPSTWNINQNNREYVKNNTIKKDKIVLSAILSQDLSAAKQFIEKGFTIPKSQDLVEEFYSDLLQEDNVELLKYLIEELKFDLKDLEFIDSNTLLTLAVSAGSFKCTELLLAKNFDPNQPGFAARFLDGLNCCSSLQVAIMFNKPKIAKLLVQNNAKFDMDSLVRLTESRIPVKEADNILSVLPEKNKLEFKKIYISLRKGIKPVQLQEGTFIKNGKIDLYHKIMNNYYKLIILKDDTALPDIINDGEKLVNRNFIKLENANSADKEFISETISHLLNCLTDIYRILEIEYQKHEKFENFLVESLDKHNDESFILEFTKFLMKRYNNGANPEKSIKYGEKIYSILSKTEGNIKEKYTVLTQLTTYCDLVKNPNKSNLYNKELEKLRNNIPNIEEIALLDLDSLLEGKIQDELPELNILFSKIIMYDEVEKKLEDYQLNGEWKKGYKFLEEIRNKPVHNTTWGAGAFNWFKTHNHPNLKYYEFIFYYYKNKNSFEAEQILKGFYDQATTSENKIWLKNIHKLYEIIIYRALDDNDLNKIKGCQTDLNKLPSTENIKVLRKALNFWLSELKKQQTSEQLEKVVEPKIDKDIVEETTTVFQEKVCKESLEEITLRLPKELSVTFEEIELLLAAEKFEEIAKIDQKLVKKYFTHKKEEAGKQKYLAKDEDIKFSWCIDHKIYKSEEVQKIDKNGKYYATISEKLDLDKVKLEKYQTALEHGLAAREKGSSGIKTKKGQPIKLKINKEDNRLITDIVYKNPQGVSLIIFDDEKPHSQIKDISLKIFEVPDSLVDIIGEVM